MKRCTICCIAIAVLTVAGASLVASSGQTQLPKRSGVILLAVQIIESNIRDQALLGSVIDLFLLLDDYDRTGIQAPLAGYDREIKIASAARHVFAMYERNQNRFGFDSALKVQPIVAGVLRLALEVVNRAAADEQASESLRNTNQLIADYYYQVVVRRPIARAGD